MNKFHLAYSKEIYKELFDTALERKTEGCVRVDNSLLRQLLLVILAKNGFVALYRIICTCTLCTYTYTRYMA